MHCLHQRYLNNMQTQYDCTSNNEKVVQLLIDKGADVNVQGGYYGNALQAASYRIHELLVQLLVGNGADVNAQGGHYDNALHAANERGHKEVVQLLIKYGANFLINNGTVARAAVPK